MAGAEDESVAAFLDDLADDSDDSDCALPVVPVAACSAAEVPATAPAPEPATGGVARTGTTSASQRRQSAVIELAGDSGYDGAVAAARVVGWPERGLVWHGAKPVAGTVGSVGFCSGDMDVGLTDSLQQDLPGWRCWAGGAADDGDGEGTD
eukprot:SAG22_NODE_7937_length_696_cov_1.192630_1_plen_150_part_10